MRRLASGAVPLALGSFAWLGCQVVGDFESLKDYSTTDMPPVVYQFPGRECGEWEGPEIKGVAARPSVMIAMRTPEDECFWMEKTEVTRAQYQEFLETDPLPGRNECAWNKVYASEENDPEAATDPGVGTKPEHPQVYVDWCDAKAYCEWLGKSLCRDDFSVPTEVSRSDWFLACSNGDATNFASGDMAVTDTCRNADNKDAEECGGSCKTPWTVGIGISCENDIQIQDLNGNVGEWTSACKNADYSVPCLVRGGSFLDQDQGLTCSATVRVDRDTSRNDIGIRCCAYE